MVEINSPYYIDLHNTVIPELNSLRGSRILVTGSTGLIGSSLVELLLLHSKEFDYRVYAGCRDIRKAQRRFSGSYDLEYCTLDVTKPIELDQEFDYIIDAASNGSPYFFSSDPVGVMKANLLGVCNLLDYGMNHGLKRFLYISSGEVYGEGCDDRWKESDSGYVDTMTTRACYPSSKRAAESLCVSYLSQYNVDVVVARISHTYGPNFTNRDDRVYAQFIRNVLNNEDIKLKSKGEQYRSWIYVVDCVSALLYILEKGQSGQAYNVANGESNITIRELADVVANLTGKNVDIPTLSEKIVGTPVTKSVFDTSKLENLGWKPRYTICQGMKNTIESCVL